MLENLNGSRVWRYFLQLLALQLLLVQQAMPEQGASSAHHSTAPAAQEESPPPVDFQAELALDSLSNVHGGRRTGTAWLGNMDLIATLDTEAAGIWKDGEFRLYLLGTFGGEPSAYSGEIQTADNIEAYSTFKVFEAWYDHSFSESLHVLAGLYDYNSEFDVAEFAAPLLNSSFGTQPQIAQVPPSHFPTTSLGLRVKLEDEDGPYLLAAVFDGVPGNPDDERGTQIIIDRDDGTFHALEAGARFGDPALFENYLKAGIGVWHRRGELEDFGSRPRDANSGVYFVFEKSLLAEKTSGLGLFIEGGWCERHLNVLDSFYSAGIYYQGPFEARSNDALALAFVQARFSDDFRENSPDIGESETIAEVTYTFEISDGLVLQPDVQYVWNPSADKNTPDALILGVRLSLTLEN